MLTTRAFYEITAADVGKAVMHLFGRRWLVSEFLGQVLPVDVGKRVFLQAHETAGFLQVENNEQRDRRLADAAINASNRLMHELGPELAAALREAIAAFDEVNPYPADAWKVNDGRELLARIAGGR